MKRRSFLSILAGAAGAVLTGGLGAVADLVSTTPIPLGLNDRLFFNGIPIVFDEDCPGSCVYYMNGVWFASGRVYTGK